MQTNTQAQNPKKSQGKKEKEDRGKNEEKTKQRPKMGLSSFPVFSLVTRDKKNPWDQGKNVPGTQGANRCSEWGLLQGTLQKKKNVPETSTDPRCHSVRKSGVDT
jgi:hypothetical protein